MFTFTATIDGIPCAAQRTNVNGIYHVYFQAQDATLAQIESINWAHPTLGGVGGELPEGYGYTIDDITYLHPYRCYAVRLKVCEQYLGDVTGYQAQVSALETDLEEARQDKAAAEQEAQEAQQEVQQAQQEIAAAQEQIAELEDDLTVAQTDAAQAQEQVTILAGKAVADDAETQTLRMAIETAVISLSDNEAAEVPSLSQHWAAGQQVEPGDRRYYTPTGLLYKVREGQGHTTQDSWTPDKTPAMWAVVDISHEGTVADPIPAAKGMDYIYGKYYLDLEDGKIYLCKRTGEEDGGVINLQYLPHELIGQYFEAVEA